MQHPANKPRFVEVDLMPASVADLGNLIDEYGIDQVRGRLELLAKGHALDLEPLRPGSKATTQQKERARLYAVLSAVQAEHWRRVVREIDPDGKLQDHASYKRFSAFIASPEGQKWIAALGKKRSRDRSYGEPEPESVDWWRAGNLIDDIARGAGTTRRTVTNCLGVFRRLGIPCYENEGQIAGRSRARLTAGASTYCMLLLVVKKGKESADAIWRRAIDRCTEKGPLIEFHKYMVHVSPEARAWNPESWGKSVPHFI